jgi:hypothetical protein
MDFVRIWIVAVLGGTAAGFGGVLGLLFHRLVRRPGTPADASSRSKAVAIFGAVTGVLVGTLATPLHWDVAIERRLIPRSPLEQSMDRTGISVADDPLFRERIAGKSQAEASAFGRALSAQGVVRLPWNDLRRIAEIRDHLATLSTPLCLQLWSGQQNLDDKAMQALMGRLPPAELDDLVRLTTQAARLQLHGEGTAPPARDAARTFRAVAASLGDRGDEFLRIAGQGLSAPASDGCRGVHMALQAVPNLSEADARSVMELFL